MNNIMNVVSQFQGFMQNPVGYLMQNRINIPQNMANDPNAIINHMMDNGMINQTQYNQARQMCQQMQNNPAFKGMFNRRP